MGFVQATAFARADSAFARKILIVGRLIMCPWKSKRLLDRGVSCEEALRRGDGLEPQHLAFTSADREMRVFRAIVLAHSTRPVTILEATNSQCRPVRGQAIRDDSLWIDALVGRFRRESAFRPSVVQRPVFADSCRSRSVRIAWLGMRGRCERGGTSSLCLVVSSWRCHPQDRHQPLLCSWFVLSF